MNWTNIASAGIFLTAIVFTMINPAIALVIAVTGVGVAVWGLRS